VKLGLPKSKGTLLPKQKINKKNYTLNNEHCKQVLAGGREAIG
jgi:hypothetical protein